MEPLSPFLLVKQLQADVFGLLRGFDIGDLDVAEQKRVDQLRVDLTDARLDIQDYELAETRDDQLRNAKDARARLLRAQHYISTNNLSVFGPVEVAHLTAQIGQINDRLR